MTSSEDSADVLLSGREELDDIESVRINPGMVSGECWTGRFDGNSLAKDIVVIVKSRRTWKTSLLCKDFIVTEGEFNLISGSP